MTGSSLDSEDKTFLGYHDRSDEDTDSTYNEETVSQPPRRLIPLPSDVRAWFLLVLSVSIASFLSAGFGYWLRKGCTEKECVRMTSSYSPLLDVVEYYDYQFEAELGTENVYKGHPRPELDEVWERIGRIHPISMPEEYRGVLNKTHSGIPYPEEMGGGIMVEIEVFHQLHCLDFLRKIIYADYYSRPENLPRTFEVSDKMLFNHIDHCVDYLRQFIMCASDVTPVTSNWVLTHHSPHPDFNTMHKCRNFDKLLEWAEEHDNGGVPKQSPNPSWWPAPKLADTVLDFEPDFPIPPHGPPVNDTRDM
ncbi:hypothetical protein CONLIGDRAFT_647147 [Coniochaeta ligniaria NRRL 30616]|uniref:Tat pathway signal sequence n=1 Tax=Coniochaeta ligniaria NRRL 30616 TaxID=1408157 RepID=A0A1J7JCP4_9PEZI|nr:hypothetical protein CONLIGDRAFT_647147 [Coniochaeta ligniaria NRRL 30616]